MSIERSGSAAEPSQPVPPGGVPPDSPTLAAIPVAPETGFPRERRFIFVQLLFSLTAAEIAREVAELTLQGCSVGGLLPAYAHLFLATAVVATSWVGWSVSEASLRLRVDSVFSWAFVVLLSDVVLVIFYFILVRGAEIPKVNAPLVTPSARIECAMMALIFTGYFVWDVLTKAVVWDERSGAPNGVGRRFFGPTMWARGWMSLACMVLGVVAWNFLSSVSSTNGVMLVDASLFFLVLLFRAMKEKLWPLSAVFGVLAMGAGIAARLAA